MSYKITSQSYERTTKERKEETICNNKHSIKMIKPPNS